MLDTQLKTSKEQGSRKPGPISKVVWFAWLPALWITVLLNQSFFSKLFALYPVREHLGFGLAIAVIVWLLISWFFALFAYRKVWLIVWPIAVLASAGFAYYMDSYGVLLDATMWLNVAQTQAAEAKDLLTLQLLAYLLGLGLLPAGIGIVLGLRRVDRDAPKEFITNRRTSKPFVIYVLGLVFYSSAVLVLLGVSIWGYGKNFGSFFREHKALRYYINPLGPLQGVGKWVQLHVGLSQDGIETRQSVAIVDPEAQKQAGSKPRLLLLVVGETARVADIGLNGYARQTTPELAKQAIVSYTQTEACGTSTAISVPCMFYPYGPKDFTLEKFAQNENTVDMLARLGVQVLWRDNNSSSKGVAERGHSARYENYRDSKNNTICDVECRDEGMLIGLEDWLKQHKGKDSLIVLHQMGSHGPAYFKRYPKAFERFIPICKTAQLEQCEKQEVVNTYDNTILYTDYFLAKSLNWLRAQSSDYDIAWLYISDHGESLGENGVYLHGLPKWMAPKGQTTPAMMSWRPLQDQKQAGKPSLVNRTVSHDDLFHTMLGFYGVQSKLYQKERDWWAP